MPASQELLGKVLNNIQGLPGDSVVELCTSNAQSRFDFRSELNPYEVPLKIKKTDIHKRKEYSAYVSYYSQHPSKHEHIFFTHTRLGQELTPPAMVPKIKQTDFSIT